MSTTNGHTVDRLRILLVAHGVPSQNVGGVELYTLRLARLFSENHSVTLCIPDLRSLPPGLQVTPSVEGFDIARIRVRRKKKRLLDLYKYPDVDRQFAELLDQVKPDVVHIHHLINLSTGVITESARRGIPVVLTLHDFWMNCPRGQRIAADGTVCRQIERERCLSCLKPQWQGIHRSLKDAPRRILENLILGDEAGRRELIAFDEHMRDVLGQIDRVISPSKAMLADFVAYGIDERKMVRLRYCLDSEDTTDPDPGTSKVLPERNGSSGQRENRDRVRIGYLGTLIPTKGVHLLTEAFRKLSGLPVSLDIHGVAPPYPGRKGYLAELERGVDSEREVRFRGPYQRSSLPQILRSLDVVVVPSVWMENFPQTALEALSMGVPVVAADHGGLREIVRSGVNGLKFRPGDSQDLADKLRCLIGDRDLRMRLSGRGVDIPRPSEHAMKHLEIYRELKAARSLPE